MEKLVTIVSVGVYAERQYQKQDGSQEYYQHRTWGDNNDRHENIFIITDIQTL